MVHINCLDDQGKTAINLWAKLGYREKQRLLWVTKEHWFLKDKNYQWIIGLIASFLIGFITKMLLGC